MYNKIRIKDKCYINNIFNFKCIFLKLLFCIITLTNCLELNKYETKGKNIFLSSFKSLLS